MTEEKHNTREFILLMIGVILAFGTPYVVFFLDRLHIASPSTGLLLAIVVFVMGLIMIYRSAKRIGMED